MKYLILLRPKQWLKQVFVFLPLLSLGSKIHLHELLSGLIAMAVFTQFSGSVYLYNDFRDISFDRKDIVRSKRGLASGRISLQKALLLGLILIITGFVFIYLYSNSWFGSMICISIYLLTNFVYSTYRLKKKNLLGISLVAVGFPLRFAFGCLFLGIAISYWAMAMLMLLALFMLSIKRYQLTMRNPDASKEALHEFWLLAAMTFAAFFSASYAGFVSSPATQEVWGSTTLLVSSIPVALGIVRFIELGINKDSLESEDATESVARDLPMLLLGAIYSLIMLVGKITTS